MTDSHPSGPPVASGLSDGLFAILRHKLLILVSVIATVAAVALHLMSMPPTFRSEARLVLESSTFEAGLLGELSALNQSPPATQQVEILRSRKLIRLVAMPPDAEEAPEFAKGLGLGLCVTVDDLDKHWPRATMRRRLFRVPRPMGGLKVELSRPHDALGTTVLNLKFLEKDQVRVTTTGSVGDLSQDFNLADGTTEINFHGRHFALTPDRDLKGRSFRVTLRGLDAAIDDILERLIVLESERGSGVLEIFYSDTDPGRAQMLVNRLSEVYVVYKRDRLARRAGATVKFISGEIARINAELEEAEAELVAYQEDSGATLLSENGLALVQQISELDLERARLGMSLQSHSVVMGQLKLAEVPVESIVGSIELRPLADSMFRSLIEAQKMVSELSVEYTDAWPELAEARERVEELRTAIMLHLEAQMAGLESRDEDLAEIIGGYEAELATLPRAEREIAKLQRKATSHEAVYLLLLQKMQEAKIAQAATLEDIEIIDKALPPRIRSQPNVRFNLGLGGIFGLFLGIALSLLRENMSRRIRSGAQLEAATQLAVVGTIPDFRRGIGRSRRARTKIFLALRDDPESAAAEAYRALRSNLKFLTKSQKLQSIAITSATQGEGKSTTTADLAIALAQTGKKVLLVDADLRRPVAHQYFGHDLGPGLADLLLGNTAAKGCVRESPIENLSLVTAGNAVKNPGDLLASQELQQLAQDWSEHFDHILFDVPPVLAVSDATAFLHELDGIFLLCRSDLLPEQVVEQATRRLRLSGAPLLGAILNGHRPRRLASDYASYRYGYGYTYTADGK